MYGIALCHEGVISVCRCLPLIISSCQANICSDRFVVYVLHCRRLLDSMYLCHDVCRTWACVVVSFGILRCSWSARSASVALRVDSVVSRLLLGRVLSPHCSLASIVVAFSMYIWVRLFGVVRFSSIGVHSLTPSSHRGLGV